MTFLEAIQKVQDNEGGFAVRTHTGNAGYPTYYGSLGRNESMDRVGYSFGVMLSNVFRARDWVPSPDDFLDVWSYEER